jgi:hypothetical protein
MSDAAQRKPIGSARATALALLLLAPACSKHQGPPPPATELSPEVKVDVLPSGDGDVSGKQFVGPGEGGGDMNRSGFYETLTGTTGVTIMPWDDTVGDEASLEISVESGKVRGYLQNDSNKGAGYHYVEATPGHPAKTRGHLMSGGGTLYFRMQAVGGPAKGMKHHVWGGKH